MALRGKKKKAINMLKKKAGNITLTCEAINISRDTFHRWVREDEEFRKAKEEVDEGLIDFVESKLYQNINKNDNTAIIFFLKTKGKHRGYIEKQEIEHTGAVPVENIQVEIVENNENENKEK